MPVVEGTSKKARPRDEAYQIEAFGYGGDDELFWSEMKRDNMYMSASRLKKGNVNETLKKIDGSYLVKTPKSSRTYMVIPKVSDTNYSFDNFFHGYESGVLVYKKELTGAVSDGEPGALWSRTEYYTYLNGLKVGIYTEEESGDDYRSKENGKENNNSKFVGGGAETHNYYCSYDGQGNISQVSNMAGDMPYNMYAYDSYGTQTGDDYYNEDFSGYKGYDKGPLGYKTGVRHYDPETGRFLSPDPFKGYMTDPASQHPYMYCHGNPVTYSDPSGYIAIADDAAVGAAVAVGLLALKAYQDSPAGKRATRKMARTLKTVADGTAYGIDYYKESVVIAGKQIAQDYYRYVGPLLSKKGQGKRGKGKVQPDPRANGPHTGFKTDRAGKVTKYIEYDKNGNPVRRFRKEGKPHRDKKPPFILERKKPNGKTVDPRDPEPWEMPKQ